MHQVQRVACPRKVHVVARIVRDLPVVGRVVRPLHRQQRPLLVALAGVVVDHIQNDLDVVAVQRLHHVFELADLLPRVARRTVARHGGKVAQRVVSPVVPQIPANKLALIDEVVQRQQLNRGDTQHLEVLDACVRSQTGIRSAQLLGNSRVVFRKAAHTQFVNHGVGKRGFGLADALPVVVAPVRYHYTLGHAGGGGLTVEFQVITAHHVIRKDWSLPVDLACNRLCVGVDEQLVFVETETLLRLPRTIDVEAVTLTRADAANQPMPDVARRLFQNGASATRVLGAIFVEEAHFHSGRILRVEREIGSLGGGGCAKWIRFSGENGATHA